MLFRFIFVLLLLLCSLSETYAGWCHTDCGSGDTCSSDAVAGKGLYTGATAVGDVHVCNEPYKLHGEATNVRIGWGDTCASPSGNRPNTPNGSSCLTTHNLLGQVLDVILTVGIAEVMFNQFCSFSAGDGTLEGGILSGVKETSGSNCISVGSSGEGGGTSGNCKTMLDLCVGETPTKKKKKCMSCIFRGLSYDSTNNKCATSGDVSFNLGESYVRNDADFCKGIPNTDRPLVSNSTKKTVVHNGQVVYCPLMRCNIPTNYIRTKYYDNEDTRMAIIGGLAAGITATTGGIGAIVGIPMLIAAAATGHCCDLDSITDSQHEHVGFWGAVNLKGTTDGDRICATMLMPTGYTTVACKFRVPPVVNYPEPHCKLASTSCTSGATRHSLWVMPLTSTLMECVNDVISLFFEPQAKTSLTCPTNHLFLFQSNLRNIVKILLVLYVILYGLNLAVGGGQIKKGEIFSFIFKFALVTFFSVGTFDATPQGDGDFNTQQAESVNKNGLEYIKDLAFAGMNNFSLMVMNAAGPKQTNGGSGSLARPCIFESSNPKYQGQQKIYSGDGKLVRTITKDYGYLALWDAIDCHLSFYLGLAAPTTLGLQNSHHGTAGVIATDVVGGVLAMVFPALLSIEILLMIFALALTIFLFSIIVYFTNLYIVAMLAVTILIFFGPFFVPMVLFNYTRSMFDQWSRLLFGYALQPLVISGFIALFVTTFHFVFYTGCTFTEPNDFVGFPYWVLETPISDVCKKSFGYVMSQFNPTVAMQRVGFGGGIFYYNTFAHHFEETVETAFDGMMLCTFFAFLFYFFAEQLSGLAADLTGSMQLGSTISPNAITNLALKKLTSGVSKQKPGLGKETSKAKRSGVQVGGAAQKSGVSVSSSSGGAAKEDAAANRAAFKELPFSSSDAVKDAVREQNKAAGLAQQKEFAKLSPDQKRDARGERKRAQKAAKAARASGGAMPPAVSAIQSKADKRFENKQQKKAAKAARVAKALAKKP